MSTPVDSAPGAGVIHNIGYRRYDGARLGRFDVLLAMYSQTLKGSYGIGRGAVAKLFPWFLVFCTMLPAFILVAIQAQAPEMFRSSGPLVAMTGYTMWVQMVPALFLAVQAPQAVSRDLRFNTIPLYFSRPLTYRDYVLARVAGVWTGLFALLAAPLLLLYVGALLIELPFGETTLDLLQALLGVALLAFLLTGLGLLLASVTPRRGLGVAAIVAALSGSYIAASTFQNMLSMFESEAAATWAGLLSPLTLYDGVQSFLFQISPSSDAAAIPDWPAGLTLTAALIGFCALSYGLLLLRYRKVSSR